MSCRPHGYPWPSLATFPYRSSPPAGLLNYIPYLRIAAVCRFELVVLLLLGHCLILLATSLCSCRVASFPAVLLASKWCIHTAVSTWPLLGRKYIQRKQFHNRKITLDRLPGRIHRLHLFREIRTSPLRTSILDITLKVKTSPGALGNGEYFFMAITVTRSESTWWSPNYEPNRIM